MKREEDAEQIELCSWLDEIGVKYYHPANGGARNAITGALLKKMGVKRGVPDICILKACNGYHGLYIELKKKKGGRVSPEQRQWLQDLNDEGYRAVVCRGADEAKREVEEYLNNGGKK